MALNGPNGQLAGSTGGTTHNGGSSVYGGGSSRPSRHDRDRDHDWTPEPVVEKPKAPTASDTLAQIHREEWEDWKKRFQPRIEDLARQATTGELTQADIGRADGSVLSSFSNAAQAQQIREDRLGIRTDSRQSAASERLLGLNKTAARASARNNTRIAGQDRDMQILAGGGNIGLGANQ